MIRGISQITVIFCFVFLLFLIFSKIHQNRTTNFKLIVTNSTFEPLSTVALPNATFGTMTTPNPLYFTEFPEENRFIASDLNFFSYGSEIWLHPDIYKFLIKNGKFNEEEFAKTVKKEYKNEPIFAERKIKMRYIISSI